MSRKSKKLSATLAFLSLFVLASCDTQEVKLPNDYKEPVFTVTKDKDGNTLAEDKKRDYYDGVSTSDAVYERTVKDILLKLSEKAHEDKPVYNVVDDTSLKYSSVADHSGTFPTASGDSNLESRAKDNMVSAASGSSYLKDNLFYETKYAKYLNENYYYLDIDSSKVSSTGKFLTPDLTYSDIYSSTAEDAYKLYREHELYEDMKVNYLTSEYIYNKSYASIGNTNARKVQIVSIVDRSDESGDAKLLLDAYVKDYILGTGGNHSELLGKDPDFKVLSRLWKGITKKDAESLDLHSSRYGDVVLSSEEESWLEEYNLRTDSTSRTLLGKVSSDVEKINRGLDNWKLINSDLESTYTGTYAHSLEEGIESAVDDIAKRNLVTKGLYLKGTGIS